MKLVAIILSKVGHKKINTVWCIYMNYLVNQIYKESRVGLARI